MFPSSENNYLLLLSVKIIITPHSYSKTNKTVATQALENFCFHQKKVKGKLQADQDKFRQSKSDRCQSQGHAKVVAKTVWLVTSSSNMVF